MAVATSVVVPLIMMFAKDVFIDQPKERVDLVYDITQPRPHAKGKILTYIEIENVGRKGASDFIIFEVEFQGGMLEHEWKTRLDPSNIVEEKKDTPPAIYRLVFKNLGPSAKIGFLLTSERDLARLPLLKYNEVAYKARFVDTHNRFQPPP